MAATDEPIHDLAIVGGGPAGAAVALAAQARAPHWRVLWCRGPEAPARDVLPAYGGNSPVHRLNVPVERMGLEVEVPVDFLDWLRTAHPQRQVQPGEFVPRCWFGEYLWARTAGCGTAVRFGAVSGIARDGDAWRLAFDDGRRVAARRVALCLGLPAGASMPEAPPCWIADPWAWWRALPDRAPADGATVLIVGSGLTAVDMVLGLRERGFAGRIRVVSPAGRWSEAHATVAPLDAEARRALDAALDAAPTARSLLRAIRDAACRHPWRAVVDALRAETNARWSALAPDEQRRLLRHAFDHWNRHRHRMAQDVLDALQADTALSMEVGRVCVVDGAIVKRHRGIDTPLDVALALDCRGPAFRTALAGDSLLSCLVRDGVLEAHPFGTGVVPPREPTLAVIGAARFGERFETSAVPELRQQAAEQVQRWIDAAPGRGGDQTHSRGTRYSASRASALPGAGT